MSTGGASPIQKVLKGDVEAQPPTADGIISLTSRPSVVYDPWLDLSSRERLRESLAVGVSAAIAVHTASPAAAAATSSNIYDLSRGNFQALCPLRRDAVVLDYGCGLGAISRSFARTCGTVVGLDACYERLMVNAAVNVELDVRNVSLVFGNHESLDAFATESFDGLVLNGVLEWVPEYIPGSPRAVQRDFLSACRRILKKDGWLYVGIENRWGFRYFLGRRDDHTGLRFSNLLPRRLADVYSRAVRRRPYRTYTYGRRALEHLLHEAGFAKVQSYSPIPDYRHFNLVVRPDVQASAAGIAGGLGVSKRWKRALIEWPPFVEHAMPSLSAVAFVEGAPVAPWLSGLTDDRSPRHAYVKYDQVSFWYERDRRWRVREIGLSGEAEHKLRHVETLAERLRRASHCPIALRSVTTTTADGYVWADREAIDGRVLASFDKAEQESHAGEVVDALREVHAAGPLTGLPVLSLGDVVADYAGGGLDRLRPAIRAALDELGRLIERRLEPAALLMHGDCSSKNIVMTGGRAELIDWEWSRVVAFPAYDILKFAWTDREDPRTARDAVDMASYLDDDRARSWCVRLHPGIDWSTAVAIYWLLRTARALSRFRHGGMPLDWLPGVVEPGIEETMRLVRSAA